jgi:peroxiredoxin Q/BCP
MNHRRFSIPAVCVAALLLSAVAALAADAPAAAKAAPPAASAPTLKVGDPAPDFSLMGSDGKMHSLKDYAGKQTVVIAWFPKAFTGGCTAECKSMHEHGDAIKAYDVAYFTASVDDAETNKKFAESLSVDYPILSDPDKSVAKAYGVLMPEYGVANRWTFYIGPDGKIVAIDTKVKPATAAEDVAAQLSTLKTPKRKA